MSTRKPPKHTRDNNKRIPQQGSHHKVGTAAFNAGTVEESLLERSDEEKYLHNLVAATWLIMLGFSVIGACLTCWFFTCCYQKDEDSPERFEMDAWNWNPSGLSVAPRMNLWE